MEASRRQVHAHIANGIHPWLILNLDQVWRQALRSSKEVYMKGPDRSLAKPLSRSPVRLMSAHDAHHFHVP